MCVRGWGKKEDSFNQMMATERVQKKCFLIICFDIWTEVRETQESSYKTYALLLPNSRNSLMRIEKKEAQYHSPLYIIYF